MRKDRQLLREEFDQLELTTNGHLKLIDPDETDLITPPSGKTNLKRCQSVEANGTIPSVKIVSTGRQVESSTSTCAMSNLKGYIAVGILCAVNLLNYMDRFTIAGVLENIKSYFSISDSESGLLQTVFICAYMIFAPIFGYLGDRYSRKMVMSVGILIWSASVLASSFAEKHHFWLFVLSRGVVGIGEASYSTVAPTIIADLFTSDMRSRMLMVFYFAIPVGSGLGFVVGAYVTKALNNQWQWGVRLTPFLGVVCLCLIVFILEEPQRGQSEVSRHELKPTTWFQDLKQLTKNKSYIWSTMGFTCVAFVAGALSWWAPTFVVRSQMIHGGEPNEAEISLIFGVITCIAGFLGVLAGATWSQFWRRTNPRADPLICGIGMLCCTPFLFLSLCIAEIKIAWAWPLMFIGITCLSLNWSIISDILLYIIIPSRRGTASAFQILLSHLLGDASSPYLIGVVSDALTGKSDSNMVIFMSLKHALFIPTFICVLGGFFFLGTAWFVASDRRKADLIAKGEVSESDEDASATVSHTEGSGQHPSLSVPVASAIPTSDSSVGLLSAEVHQVNEQPEQNSSSSDENSGGETEGFDADGRPAHENLVRVKVGHIRRRVSSGKAPLASSEGLENPVVTEDGLTPNPLEVRL